MRVMIVTLKKSFRLRESGIILPRGKTGRVVNVILDTGELVVDFGLQSFIRVSPEDVE